MLILKLNFNSKVFYKSLSNTIIYFLILSINLLRFGISSVATGRFSFHPSKWKINCLTRRAEKRLKILTDQICVRHFVLLSKIYMWYSVEPNEAARSEVILRV